MGNALTNHILVVGNLKRWKAEGRLKNTLDDFQFIDFEALNEETLLDFKPDIILSPLFGDTFDALDVALRLQELGFKGRYRSLADRIPKGDAIRADIAAHAPDVDFDVLLLGASAPLT